MKWWRLSRIQAFMAVPRDNPELLKAQYSAFSRQLPMMYLILMSSTWAVAATHMRYAPFWLATGVPVLFTLACAVRVYFWWTSRNKVPTAAVALHALQRTNRLAPFIAIFFTAWALMLFPYGDAYEKSHLAFYMAITVITCIFCLMHLRSAAMTVTLIVNSVFAVFFLATGEPALIASAATIILVSIGMIVVLMVNYRDFVSMVNAQTRARRREEDQRRLLRMIDDLPVAVMTVDLDGFRINYVNETSRLLIRRIEHLLPVTADTLLGASIDVFHRHPEYQRQLLSDPARLPHSARITLGPEVLDLKVSAVTDDDGSYLGPMLRWAIVTKEVETEERIHQLAHTDMLTGLANRFAFSEDLKEQLLADDCHLALLYIDLDGFKLINDTRGHRIGDILLEQVARRLSDVCEGKATEVGRLGGDEFAAVIQSECEVQADSVARAIIEALCEPFTLTSDINVHIGASIGVALAPAHGRDLDTLLARADMALYAAKAAGKGRVQLFQPEMEALVQERVALEARLRAVLDTYDGLFVFYQPIVNIETGQITAREALLRWHDGARSWVGPGEFIPIAEQSGLIEQLGSFVLQAACREALSFPDEAPVAVNVSATQLGGDRLVPAVIAALQQSGLPVERLELEITETALLTAEAAGIDNLSRLRALGVKIALDDFGTGYSSLSNLQMFPFDKIKIDGSFVKNAVERHESAAVIRAIADLGKRLGARTVAEGVETPEQLDLVRREGCMDVQGYLYGRPQPTAGDRATVSRLP
ncbi:EAL domain-containing protein [Martelella sp. HB161492]|uniref:putative bifunctional diguanylate cyclase/phosphodiesterase n=1 Tax=Martelella sp. HB161492 TaxID=2720726 RepID=UPI001FEEA299|nr:EAL domain-containing protein [Martelella sp. HB161492]